MYTTNIIEFRKRVFLCECRSLSIYDFQPAVFFHRIEVAVAVQQWNIVNRRKCLKSVYIKFVANIERCVTPRGRGG